MKNVRFLLVIAPIFRHGGGTSKKEFTVVELSECFGGSVWVGAGGGTKVGKSVFVASD